MYKETIVAGERRNILKRNILKRNILKYISKSKPRKNYLLLCLSLFIGLFLPRPLFLPAQEVLTAVEYFETISEQYGRITDYQADISITRDDEVMKGVMYYKSPNLLRINFEEPEEQVLVTNGEVLTIYIPLYRVIMSQQLKKHSDQTLAAMASEQGLQLLKRNYSIAYLEGPSPIPLNSPDKSEAGEEAESSEDTDTDENDGNTEYVIKLKLVWRTTDEGFREITMSIGENGLIRRMVGVTVDYEEVRFDFENILLNQNIPDARFEYESPPTANVFQNFLFEPEE